MPFYITRLTLLGYISLLFSLVIMLTVNATSSALASFPMPIRQDYTNNLKSITTDTKANAMMHARYGKLPLYFIQNDGQIDEKVRFYEKGSGHTMFFTERGVYLSLTSGQEQEATNRKSEDRNQKQDARRTSVPLVSKGSNGKTEKMAGKFEIQNPNFQLVKLIPLGANKHPEIIAEGLQKGKVNYLIGNDPEKWKTNIPTYQDVIYKDIYKNIDMKFYGNNHQLEYDIIVKPGANPSHIKLAYEGIEDLRVTEERNMEMYLKEGKIIQKKPYIYQEIGGKRVEVEGRFNILETRGKKQEGRYSSLKKPKSKIQKLSSTAIGDPKFVYGFHVASYDRRYPLIIDPVLVYSTYLGGSSLDRGYDIAVDTSGNAYITGLTESTDFPTASGYAGSYAGNGDVFVTKIDATGSSLVYSTYLGGTGYDYGTSIAVDSSENVYVSGGTVSSDFPTVAALYENYAGGDYDAFLSKIDASGSNLIFSTYLGGSDTDRTNDIHLDASDNVYITGYTSSSDFPTASAIYGSNEGSPGAFVTKVNASGKSIDYSTYLGGSDLDSGTSVDVDNSGNVYITGYTESDDFPMVAPLFGSYAGAGDAFITKINASGSGLVYSTYLGGSLRDGSHGVIVVDNSGNAYISGGTESNDFPTASALYESYAGGSSDAFITKLDASGSSLVYSTYFGGSGFDRVNGLAVDTDGSAYIAGFTNSTDFPVVAAFYENYEGGLSDVFIAKIDNSGSNLVYSTYLGGNDIDEAYGIAIDTTGNAYVTGRTFSGDYSALNPIYADYSGGGDVFVAKISSLEKGKIFGYVVDTKGKPIESVELKLKGLNTKVSKTATSDAEGLFEFTDLKADTYVITAKKKGYRRSKQTVELEEGEEEEIEIELKRVKKGLTKYYISFVNFR